AVTTSGLLARGRSAPRWQAGPTSSRLLLEDRLDAEVAVLAERRVGEDLLAGERGPDGVVAHHVFEARDLGGRLDALGVELAQHVHRLEDGGDLVAEELDLLLGDAEPSEPRDVDHLFSVDSHRLVSLPRAVGQGPLHCPLPQRW